MTFSWLAWTEVNHYIIISNYRYSYKNIIIFFYIIIYIKSGLSLQNNLYLVEKNVLLCQSEPEQTKPESWQLFTVFSSNPIKTFFQFSQPMWSGIMVRNIFPGTGIYLDGVVKWQAYGISRHPLKQDAIHSITKTFTESNFLFMQILGGGFTHSSGKPNAGIEGEDKRKTPAVLTRKM